jgi:predicted O-methyltransferase YrrM
VERAGLGDVVEVRVGAAIETLPTLVGPFDLVFIDADKRSNPEYLRWALELSRAGTLIVADNVVRGGAVADAGSDGRQRRPERRRCSPLLRAGRGGAAVDGDGGADRGGEGP